MKKTDPEKLIEFPCDYQFKAVGTAGTSFSSEIIAAVEKYVAVAEAAVCCRPSGKGNYQSVTVQVTLHSYEQMTDIYTEMRHVPGMKLLL